MSPERILIVRRSREKNRDRFNAQSREYCLENPERRKESSSQWVRNNRIKRKAHRAVEYALAKGNLGRKPCEKCGDVKSQAHHADYSKVLDVEWLCSSCHGKEHRMPICA